MIRILFLLLALIPAAAFAAEERVAPPADQGKAYVTIIGNAADLATLKEWFTTDPGLRSIQDASHFTALPTESAMYRERYAASAPAVPLVRLQDPSGRVVREFYGPTLPATAAELSAALGRAYGDCRPCRPTPAPTPAPKPAPDPAPQPLVSPTPAPKPGPAWALVVLAAVAGGGAGAYRGWKNTKL